MSRITVTQGVMDITVSLTALDCGACSVVFAMPDRFDKERREDGKAFYCPNGHQLTYNGEITQLREKLRSAERDRDWFKTAEKEQRQAKEMTEASLRATKGVVTKMRKRAIAGSCQFCHRTFANVARHVAGQHPNEKPEVE